MNDRIRIIQADGRVFVRDMAFSQVVAMLKDLDKDTRDAFWRKKETALTNGDSIYLVREGV